LVHSNASNANSSAHLSSKLDNLLRFIEHAESSLNRHTVESMRASTGGERELTDDDRGFGRLEQCTRMAHEVVSSAPSVIGETTQSKGQGAHEQEILLVGSDYGGISNNTRARIEGWIPEPAIQEDVAEEPILPSEGTASTSKPATSSRDVMSDATWTTRNGQNQHGNDFDPNSNQDVELFRVFVRKADEIYKCMKYAKAESYYHKVLERSEKLQIAVDRNDIFMKIGMACFEQQKWDKARFSFSMVKDGSRWLAERFIEDGNKKSAMYDIAGTSASFDGALAVFAELPSQVRREVHVKAGTAYFKLGKRAEAETHFFAAADVEGGISDLRCFEAEHYLAMIHFQKSELDIAEKHCLVASSGRMRMLGKSHASWHESIGLLCAIYEEKGDPVEADGYAALLPEGYKRVRALVTQG
jgi:tetratricopeptide (TPR) repeat protein